jgi:hypothetical protein
MRLLTIASPWVCCTALALSAHAGGYWLGKRTECAAPEKQRYMGVKDKTDPYCAPVGKGCATGRQRIVLTDSNGEVLPVCADARAKVPRESPQRCSAPEQPGYSDPLERLGFWCVAKHEKGKDTCAGGRKLSPTRDRYGISVAVCRDGTPDKTTPVGTSSTSSAPLRCPEPEAMAYYPEMNPVSGELTQKPYCAPGAIKDNYKFSYQKSCGKDRRTDWFRDGRDMKRERCIDR